MKEYDRVRLIVEKEKYAEDGVHKGMDGWICDPRNIEGHWLVCFDSMPTYATIEVKEKDLELVVEYKREPRRVKVTNEKEEYAQFGVHKGMQGILWELKEGNEVDPELDTKHWWVEFEKSEKLPEGALLKIHIDDMEPDEDDEDDEEIE